MSAKQRRQGIRLSAKRAYDNIQDLKSRYSPSDREQLQRKGKLLKSYLERIEPLDLEILAAITDSAELDSELENSRVFNDSLLEAIVYSEPVFVPPSPFSPHAGDPLRWQEFWDAFNASIHCREDLSPVDKLTYLRGLLKGDPFHLVEGFRVTDANYHSVVGLPQQRYGDKQAVIFAHIQALLSIPASGGEVSSLVEMHTSLERHLRCLDSLQPERDAILYSVVLSKLPRFLKIEAHRQRGATDDWDFAKLREWLQNEIRVREMGDRLHSLRPDGRKEVPGSGSKKPPWFKNGKVDGRNRKDAPSASFLVSDSKPAQCPFCSSAHRAEQCSEFPDTQSRRGQLRDRCLSCLCRGHLAKHCRNRRPCRSCQRPGHHSSLCFSQFGKPSQYHEADGTHSSQTTNTASHTSKGSHGDPVVNVATLSQQTDDHQTSLRTVMQTAVVQLVHALENRRVSARILFDTGASRSFITVSKQRELKVSTLQKECLSVSTFQSSKRLTREYEVVEFGVQCRDGSVQPVNAAVVPAITCPIQKVPLTPSQLPVPEWTLAEPLTEKSEFVDVDILIGVDYYHSFVLSQRVQGQEKLWFLSSKVGYVASGRVAVEESGFETVAVMFLRAFKTAGLVSSAEIDLAKYWDLEEVGMSEQHDKGSADEDTLSSFASTVKFDNGRYQVCWPWKPTDKELCDNRSLAYGRLKSLINRLNKSSGLTQAYNEVFVNQLDSGIIEEAKSEDENPTAVYYMPHHGVYCPDKPTTKLHVVFDASSKINPHVASLNECLYRGPILLEDLCGLLLRFRTHPVALVSDIEKAFLQVALQPDQRDVTRFLWFRDPSKPPTVSNLVVYRFCRVPFGVISSPFLLSVTVAHHLRQEDSPVAERILRDIYVDNVITGEASPGDALDHYKDAKSIFHAASMNLREWHSNSKAVMEKIPLEDRGKSTQPKVLGLKWNIDADNLELRAVGVRLRDGKVTKRTMLKTLAQVFDPCGFVSPVVITGKIIMQELWLRKLGWDEEVPADIRETWEQFANANLPSLHNICVARYLGNVEATRLQLHMFRDASSKACDVALYLRMEKSNTATTSLLISKTRLAPLKQKTTIPRMELIAVVLGTRALQFARNHLKLVLDAQFIWTDSQCVLHWLKRESMSTRFVTNRVRELKKADKVKFRYVPTADNPADLPTRGCPVESLINSTLWWKGPTWLSLAPDKWPTASQVGDCEFQQSESTVVQPAPANYRPVNPNTTTVINAEKFNSLSRLVRVTAYVFRFVRNLEVAPDARLRGNLLLKEIAAAQMWWIKQVQAEHCSEYGQKLSKQPQKAKLGTLATFRDDDGFLRCNGRIDNADVPYDARFPILLPKHCHFTDLVIMSYHKRAFHSGVAVTLCNIRQSFWIPSGRSTVKKVLRSCTLCIRYQGGPFRRPPAPPLPKIRLTESPAFTCTGLDYMGPLLARNSDQTFKVWICLYTCAVTRAVHLEVVESLSTEHFMFALRRLLAIYGLPCELISDNGSQFHTASKIIRKFEEDANNSLEFQDFSLSTGLRWKFIPELSPWMGGFYERLVGVTKSALRKSLLAQTVTLVELQTLVAEVSSIVNNRSLTYVDSIPDMLPLTPMQTICPLRKQNSPLMPPNSKDDDHLPFNTLASDLVTRWRKMKAILKNFWQSWRLHYLLGLRERAMSTNQRGISEWMPKVG